MRDVQKGRKSWLERLTSPPESEDDETMSRDSQSYEPSSDVDASAARDSRGQDKVGPDRFDAFAPPGLRPPPSDDLKSTPPERSNDQAGSAFESAQTPSPFAPERLHLDPDSGHYAPDRHHFESDSGRFSFDHNHFDGGLDDPTPARPLPAPSANPRDSWDGPVSSHTRSDKSAGTEGSRLPGGPGAAGLSGASGQPGPAGAPGQGRSSLSRLSGMSGSGLSGSGGSSSSTWQPDLSPSTTKPRVGRPAPPPSFDPDPMPNGSGAAPQDAVPRDAVPQDAVPRDTVPQDAIPQDAMPQDAMPQDTPPDLGFAGDSLSRPSEAEQVEAARKRHVDELQHRWLVTQAQLLDDPRDAVREAGLLIGDAMQFVTSTFTDHRDRIEREWRNNDSMSTDELRTVMRRYRNLFQYVLSASQLPDI
jgi:hypothetical protein